MLPLFSLNKKEEESKRRVTYFYNEDSGSFHYGSGHPMKPHRLRLTHHLLLSYDMYSEMEVFKPHTATTEELETFHAKDYISFLKAHTDGVQFTNLDLARLNKYNVGEFSDCPLFPNLYEFMTLCAGGSLDAAAMINSSKTDICINWSGGLHHAKKGEASGFCYVNDIVLCILELLKVHKRVLYVDIDIHHGDGVEEAFYTTDRVMTCSFHKYGEFFPGSGDINEIGAKEGKYYSVNVPLRDGLTDDSFQYLYQPILKKIIQVYQPEAIVMCCGADSIAGDRLGCWNMSIQGHASCIAFLKSFQLPMILLGGGGYTPKNVARCWTYETAIAIGKEIDEEIPLNYYSHAFVDNTKLSVQLDPNLKESNDKQYLDKCISFVLQQLSQITAVPSVQFKQQDKNLVDLERFKQRLDELEEQTTENAEEELRRTIQERKNTSV